MCHLVILEKDPMQRALLENMIQRGAEYRTHSFSAETKNTQLIAMSLRKQPEIVVVGLTASEDYNLKLIASVKQQFVNTPILIVAEHTQNVLVTTMLRHGATHFLTKPFSSSQLLHAIEHTRNNHKPLSTKSQGWQPLSQQNIKLSNNASMAGNPLLHSPVKLYGRPVLIQGEAGTGKNMYIQTLKHHNKELFPHIITVNASLSPDILLRRLQDAKNGILHIKTKGNLSERSQQFWQQQLTKLHNQPMQIIINHSLMPFTPTRNALLDYCTEHKTQIIAMEPLRERKSDIPHLAYYFLQQYAAMDEFGAKSLSPKALHKLKNYSWPGNMHQLQTVIFLTATNHDSDVIDEEDLIFHEPSSIDSSHFSAETQMHDTMPIITPIDEHGDLRSLQEIEDEILTYALSCRGYSRSYIARKLGIGRTTLYRKAQHLEAENIASAH